MRKVKKKNETHNAAESRHCIFLVRKTERLPKIIPINYVWWESESPHHLPHEKIFSILSFPEQTQIATSFSIFYLGLTCQNVSEKDVLLCVKAARNIILFVSSKNG